MQQKSKVVLPIMVLALFMVFSITSFSQTSRFSLSINSLTTNFNYGKEENGLKPYKKNFKGLQVGISYQAGISPLFSVVSELYFARKGGNLKAYNPLTINKSTLRLYTMEMPILARLHCNKLYLNAGPYGAYNLSGRLKTEGAGGVPEMSSKVSFGRSEEDFKRWDFGVQAGAGYQFSSRRNNFILDARYGYGLTSISRGIERYNRMLNISLVVSRLQKKKQADKQG